MIGPDFRRPPAPVADQWLEAGDRAVETDRQEYRDWWTVLERRSSPSRERVRTWPCRLFRT
jgi:hypothetical protein